jgi:hydrogenase expression/formation protein HypE
MLSCPIPKSEYDKILLAHGGGGKLTHQLIEKIFASAFENDELNKLGDSAVLNLSEKKMAFTTDSYVVDPIFFPGGNIGDLAVNGTVNDLAVAGAEPKYISSGFIIEEGFPIQSLWEVVLAMKKAAEIAGVSIVTGDTKVVEKGKGDKLFINTSGIGIIKNNIDISPLNISPGDKIILSGELGNHGIAILSVREGIQFESLIKSDTAPLNILVNDVLKFSSGIKMMRDITRGGLSSVLNEIAGSASLGIEIYEDNIPVNGQVEAACELLGLDPLYIANEGKLIVIVKDEISEDVLTVMRKNRLGKDSRIIGQIVTEHPKQVIKNTSLGSRRIIDMIRGEQLPRIC